MATYWWTTTLKELYGSGESVSDRASQRQMHKDQMKQNSDSSLVTQMEAESDALLNQSLNTSDTRTSNMNSTACNLTDLAVAMDKRWFQNNWVHIDKKKYPNANAIVQQWRNVFPNDAGHIDRCIAGTADLPTTLMRLGITLTDEDREMLEEKNQMSMVRNMKFNPNYSTRSVITPQNSEQNDNLFWIWHVEPTSYEDADNKALWFAKNVLGSLWNLWVDLYDIVANPLDSLSTIAKIPVWVVNNISWLDDNLNSMTEDRLYNLYNEANQIADWLGDYLVERYWGTDENGNLNDFIWWISTLWNTLYKDPAWMLSDIAWIIGWGAWITKTALKNTKYANAASKASKIQKAANAVDPVNIFQHPLNAVSDVKKWVGKTWKYAKNTDIGKTVTNVVDKIWNYVVQSDKVKSLRWLADTSVWKFLFPEANDLYKKIAPMSSNKIADFEATFWEKYGDYLNRMWVKWKPAEIVDKLQYQTDALYKESTNAFKEMSENWTKIKITDPKEAWDIRDMLAWNIQNQRYLDPYNTAALREMWNIYNTFLTTWEIDPVDFLAQKRYFERKSKFTYAHPNNYDAQKWQRATNIDSTARDVMLNFADEQGYKNLRQVNEQIRKNRAIIDWMWEKIMKGYQPWTIWLSDVIYAAASRDPNALTRLAAKWVFNNPTFNNRRLNASNKVRWIQKQPRENIDIDEIRRVNAENRINDAYASAMWDWTPRLLDSAAWWVVATDSMDWAKMRDADAISDAEKIIETYANSPWDVEKKVVEFEPTSKVKTDKSWRTVTQQNVFSSLLE